MEAGPSFFSESIEGNYKHYEYSGDQGRKVGEKFVSFGHRLADRTKPYYRCEVWESKRSSIYKWSGRNRRVNFHSHPFILERKVSKVEIIHQGECYHTAYNVYINY